MALHHYVSLPDMTARTRTSSPDVALVASAFSHTAAPSRAVTPPLLSEPAPQDSSGDIYDMVNRLSQQILSQSQKLDDLAGKVDHLATAVHRLCATNHGRRSNDSTATSRAEMSSGAAIMSSSAADHPATPVSQRVSSDSGLSSGNNATAAGTAPVVPAAPAIPVNDVRIRGELTFRVPGTVFKSSRGYRAVAELRSEGASSRVSFASAALGADGLPRALLALARRSFVGGADVVHVLGGRDCPAKGPWSRGGDPAARLQLRLSAPGGQKSTKLHVFSFEADAAAVSEDWVTHLTQALCQPSTNADSATLGPLTGPPRTSMAAAGAPMQAFSVDDADHGSRSWNSRNSSLASQQSPAMISPSRLQETSFNFLTTATSRKSTRVASSISEKDGQNLHLFDMSGSWTDTMTPAGARPLSGSSSVCYPEGNEAALKLALAKRSTQLSFHKLCELLADPARNNEPFETLRHEAVVSGVHEICENDCYLEDNTAVLHALLAFEFLEALMALVKASLVADHTLVPLLDHLCDLVRLITDHDQRLVSYFAAVADDLTDQAVVFCDTAVRAYGTCCDVSVALSAKESDMSSRPVRFVAGLTASSALLNVAEALQSSALTLVFNNALGVDPAASSFLLGVPVSPRATFSAISYTRRELDVLRETMAGVDAVKFWLDNDLKVVVSVQSLLACLQKLAQAKRIVPMVLGETPFAEIPGLYSFFANDICRETTGPARFAEFLDQHTSVAMALQPKLQQAVSGMVKQLETREFALSPRLVSKDKATADWVNRWRFLRPLDFGCDLAKHCMAFVPGTREWAIADVLRWNALPPGAAGRQCLWLQAAAGMGKSVLAAQLVQHFGTLKEDRMFVAGYFFFSFNNALRCNVLNVITTLAFHLAQSLPAVAVVINEWLSQSASYAELRHHVTGHTTVKAAFDRLIAEPLWFAGLQHDIVLVIDGLDEVAPGPARVALLDLVGNLLPSLPTRVRVIVTSRADVDISAQVKCVEPLTWAPNDARNVADIALYLRHTVTLGLPAEQLPSEAALVYESEFHQGTIQHLGVHADGVFLAAVGCVEIIRVAEPQLQTLAALKEMFIMRGELLVDANYRYILSRLDRAMQAYVVGSDKRLQSLVRGVLQTVLNVLVAAVAPVHRNLLPLLCGGQSAAGTSFVANALESLFFAAGDVSTPLVACHKAVYDFLQSRQRAGAWAVDCSAGHAMLARASLYRWVNHAVSDGQSASFAGAFVATQMDAYVAAVGAAHLAECCRRGQSGEHQSFACAAAEENWIVTLHSEKNKAVRRSAACSVLKLAACYLRDCGEYVLSLAWFEVALAEFVPSFPDGTLEVLETAEVLLLLARVAWRAQNISRAIEVTEIITGLGARASNVDSVVVRDLSLRLAWVLYNMAFSSVDQGQFYTAYNLLAKALRLRLDFIGRDHAETARVYNLEGVIFQHHKDLQQACALFESCLEIRQAVLNRAHPETAAVLTNLATVLHILGRRDEALDAYNRSIDILCTSLGDNHVDLANLYNNVAALFKEKEDFANAKHFFEKSLQVKCAAHGEGHNDVANTCHNLGQLHDVDLNDLVQAHAYYQRAFLARKQCLGEHHERTQRAKQRVDTAEWRLRRRSVTPPVELQDDFDNKADAALDTGDAGAGLETEVLKESIRFGGSLKRRAPIQRRVTLVDVNDSKSHFLRVVSDENVADSTTILIVGGATPGGVPGTFEESVI